MRADGDGRDLDVIAFVRSEDRAARRRGIAVANDDHVLDRGWIRNEVVERHLHRRLKRWHIARLHSPNSAHPDFLPVPDLGEPFSAGRVFPEPGRVRPAEVVPIQAAAVITWPEHL